jgi:(1->4)-alpha-D-glucan 1-alpha-D-glucosylmutase
MAFVRNSASASVVVVVPRLLAGLLGNREGPPIGSAIWEDTYLELPRGSNARSYRNVLTGKVLEIGTRVTVAEVLAELPVALYVS